VWANVSRIHRYPRNRSQVRQGFTGNRRLRFVAVSKRLALEIFDAEKGVQGGMSAN